MSSAAEKTDRVTLTPLAGRRLGGRGNRPANGAADNNAGRVSCFVAGPENQLVAAVINKLIASLNVPLKGGGAAVDLPSPLVLTGPTGSGKTHLAIGLAELWRQKRGDAEVACYSAGDFGRALAEAIADQRVRDFRRDLRRRRLLVIDDAHRLGESENKMQELRHTLDAIAEHGGLVLLTLGTGAGATEFSRPLLSRLAGGLSLPIAPPGREARRELLRHAATAVGCSLDEAALETLAEQLPAEPPRVLRAAAELRRRQGARVDAQAAERLISDDKNEAHSPPLKNILRVVARYHQVPLRVLTSASRKQGVVAARAVAIYLARELTPMSYAQIGQMLGGRDHTTVMHNYRRIARELPKDRALLSAVEDLKRLLAG